MRNYQIYHDADGWGLCVQDSKPLGVFLEWVLDHTCMEWWGRYENIPFCWVTPWHWTFKIGTEDHNLGGLWCIIADRLYAFAWDHRKDVLVTDIRLTADQAQAMEPHFYNDCVFLDEE